MRNRGGSFFKDKIGFLAAKRLVKQIPKEEFIRLLKEEWNQNLPKNRDEIDVDLVVDGSIERIKKSGLKKIFDVVGITREDLVEALGEVIRSEKSPNN